MPLSCYGARTGAGRNVSPGAGRDGLGGDAHRFSHSRRIAGRAVHAIDATRKDRGERLLTPAGTSFYVRRAGASRSALLNGCAAERPSGRPEPRAKHAAVGEAAREGRERQGPST